MREYPQWATPQRRAVLAELNALLSSGCCTYGEGPCPILGRFTQAIHEKIGKPNGFLWLIRAALATPKILRTFTMPELLHFPPWLTKELIAYWKADDREAQGYLHRLEKKRLHALRPQIKRRGPFDSIRREQYLADRPVFEIVAVGVSAFTFKRVAQVTIPELRAILWVDLTGLEISKGKFRKLARFKRGAAPKAMEPLIIERCRQTVQRFLNRAPSR